MGKLSKKKLRSLICFALLFWEIRKTYIPGFESSSIQHALGTDANIQSARNLNRNLSLSFSDSMGVTFVGLTCVSKAFTDKSLSEALIFASINPQYHIRLFTELRVQYMKIATFRTWGEHVVYRNCFWHSEQFLYTTCSPQVWAWNFHVLNL